MPTPNTEKKIINLIRARGKLGRKKYKASMDRRDLKPSDWIQHFQEEMCDGLQYAERMKAFALLTESAAQILAQLADNSKELASLKSLSQTWMKSYNAQFSQEQTR